MSKRHQEPLPPVDMEPLRRLVQWVSALERMSRDEYVPEAEVPPCFARSGDGEYNLPISALSQLLASGHIAAKATLRDCLAFAGGKVFGLHQQAKQGFRDVRPVEADVPLDR